MDINPPVSRDPRLSSRGGRPSLPSRTSYNEAPQRLPPPAQPSTTQPGDQFIRSVSDLVQTAVFAATTKSEKERLQKKRGTTDDLLRKARGHAGFPSTVEFFQHARADEEKMLEAIDLKIGEHESNYQRLESDLRNKWAASAQDQAPKSEEKIKNLQNDLKSANNRISDLQRDIAGILDHNKALQKELNKLQGLQVTQQKSFADYTNSLGAQANNIKQHTTRIEQLEREVKTSAKAALEDFQQRLASPATGQSTNPKLELAVQSLDRRLEELQTIQSTKDDLQFAEMEEIKNSLAMVKNDHDHIAESVRQVSQAVPADAIEQRVNALTSAVQQMQLGLDTLETLKVALYSLESRYNNLTTEPIVRQMLGAMHEMENPSIDQLRKELAVQKRQLNEELPALMTKRFKLLEEEVKASIVSQNDLISQTRAECNHIVGSFLSQYGWLSKEAFQSMEADLKSLAEKSNIVEKEMRSKKTEDDTKNESLKTDLSSLKDTVEQLSAELSRSSANKDEIDRVRKTLSNDIQSLKDSMNQLSSKIAEAKSTTDHDEVKQHYEALNSQVKSVQDTIVQLSTEVSQTKSDLGQEKDIRALELRIAALEKSTIQSYQILRGELEDLEKAAHPQPIELFPEKVAGSRATQEKTADPKPSNPNLAPGAKLKRPHLSSEDEKEGSRTHSPHSESPASSVIAPGESKKRKKKKKRRFESELPIQIDD